MKTCPRCSLEVSDRRRKRCPDCREILVPAKMLQQAQAAAEVVDAVTRPDRDEEGPEIVWGMGKM